MPLHTTLCESNLPLNLLGACDSSLGNFKQTKESKKRQLVDDLPATSAISGCTPNAMKGSGWSAPTVPFQRDWDNLAELLTDDTQPKSSSFHFGQTSEQFPKNVSSSRSVRDRDCPFHDMARRFLKTEECHTAPHYRSEKDRCNVNGLLQNENISPSMWALSTTAVTPDSKLSALQQSASFAQSLHRKHPNELMDESNTAIPSKSLTVDNKIDDDFLALAESLLSKPSQEGNEAKKYDRFKFKCETKQTIFAETSTRQQSNTQSNSDIGFKKKIAQKKMDKTHTNSSGFDFNGNVHNGTMFSFSKNDDAIKEVANQGNSIGKKQDGEKIELPSMITLKNQEQGNLFSHITSKRVKFGSVKINIIDTNTFVGFNDKFNPAINVGRINFCDTPKAVMTVNEFEFRRKVRENLKSNKKNSVRAQPQAHKASRKIGRKKHLRIIQQFVRRAYKDVSQKKTLGRIPTLAK
mmetsp:Transcript_19796/g.28808  ORF Transcript_19796/g.28808 Transcript_19796/m.28808 type:complete len:465 (-) Transcript_19796:161-1555(-)